MTARRDSVEPPIQATPTQTSPTPSQPATQLTVAEELNGYLEMWKQSVTVQQHFNEICWKIRGLALTALTAVLGFASISASDTTKRIPTISLWKLEVNSASAVLLVGALVWLAFFFVDANWYHRLLKGAVGHASLLEIEIKRFLPAAGLTESISTQSPSRVFSFLPELHSTEKLRAFYWSITALLLLLAGVLQFGN